MFRFFRIILFFLLGYKIIRMLFSEDKSNQKVSPNPPKQNINDNPSPNTASANSKFSEAEVIDYEEVK